MSEEKQEHEYQTRVMRASPLPRTEVPWSVAQKKWKYKNTSTGRIEFHDSEHTADHLRLICDPSGKVHTAPEGTPANG